MSRYLALIVWLAVTSAANAQLTRISATVIDRAGRPVADAVVVAVPTGGVSRPPSRPLSATIHQVGKEFRPRVSLVSVGTPVAFPNHDEVKHHVYSFSPAKRFELPLYRGIPPHPVVFDRAGVVVIGCNIHDWMVAYVYVSESPHAALTQGDGQAVIDQLVPRSYTVRVWHPGLEVDEASTQQVVDTSRYRHATIAWTLDLKPEVRAPRAPAAYGGDY